MLSNELLCGCIHSFTHSLFSFIHACVHAQHVLGRHRRPSQERTGAINCFQPVWLLTDHDHLTQCKEHPENCHLFVQGASRFDSVGKAVKELHGKHGTVSSVSLYRPQKHNMQESKSSLKLVYHKLILPPSDDFLTYEPLSHTGLKLQRHKAPNRRQ